MRRRLDETGVDISMGGNTTVFDEKIDNGVIRAESKSDKIELLKVNSRTASLHAVGAKATTLLTCLLPLAPK